MERGHGRHGSLFGRGLGGNSWQISPPAATRRTSRYHPLTPCHLLGWAEDWFLSSDLLLRIFTASKFLGWRSYADTLLPVASIQFDVAYFPVVIYCWCQYVLVRTITQARHVWRPSHSWYKACIKHSQDTGPQLADTMRSYSTESGRGPRHLASIFQQISADCKVDI